MKDYYSILGVGEQAEEKESQNGIQHQVADRARESRKPQQSDHGGGSRVASKGVDQRADQKNVCGSNRTSNIPKAQGEKEGEEAEKAFSGKKTTTKKRSNKKSTSSRINKKNHFRLTLKEFKELP